MLTDRGPRENRGRAHSRKAGSRENPASNQETPAQKTEIIGYAKPEISGPLEVAIDQPIVRNGIVACTGYGPHRREPPLFGIEGQN
jgi:hypothetical protein